MPQKGIIVGTPGQIELVQSAPGQWRVYLADSLLSKINSSGNTSSTSAASAAAANIDFTTGSLSEVNSDVLKISGTGSLINGSLTLQVFQAGTVQDGYLSQADWNTFNGKQNALTLGNFTEATSSVLTITGGTGAVVGNVTVQVKQASASQSGFLSNTDWNTFNGKQNALTLGNFTEATSAVLTITGGTGAIVGSGLSIQVKQASASQSGYLSSGDWSTFNGKLSDAPNNTSIYGRQGGAWVVVSSSSGGTDILGVQVFS